MRVSTGPKRIGFGLLGAAALAALGFALWPREAQHPPAERYAYAPADGGALPRLWKVPEFSARDQHGAPQNATSLGGRPAIVDFIFTQCTSACPMMTSKLVLLQRELDGVPVRFVSFSVDPAHDTPAALARYADSWNASEARWTLLATEAEALQEILVGFRVTAKATRDPADPIVHSSVFLLVDAEGWVRGVYESEDPQARRRLVDDTRALAAPSTTAAPTRAAVSMGALGCAGCHANPRLAPALDGLYGAEVRLQNGMRLVADEAYLRRALLDPTGELVAGYSAIMPSYAGLDAATIEALVAELRGPGEAGAARPEHKTAGHESTRSKDAGQDASAPSDASATEVALVEDPVCHMMVRASAETVHVHHRDHDVYFCSEMCRDSFLASAAQRDAGGN